MIEDRFLKKKKESPMINWDSMGPLIFFIIVILICCVPIWIIIYKNALHTECVKIKTIGQCDDNYCAALSIHNETVRIRGPAIEGGVVCRKYGWNNYFVLRGK